MLTRVIKTFLVKWQFLKNNMGRVKVGQEVLIKLKSYPFEEFGMLKGEIKYIADIPYKDSVVYFERWISGLEKHRT